MMSSFLPILSVIFLSSTASGCTPCGGVDIGSINMNRDNAWSLLGTYCLGHTENENEISAKFELTVVLNETASNSNYDKQSTYTLAIYNDQSTSYPALNSSMSCSTKTEDGKYVKIKREFNF